MNKERLLHLAGITEAFGAPVKTGYAKIHDLNARFVTDKNNLPKLSLLFNFVCEGPTKGADDTIIKPLYRTKQETEQLCDENGIDIEFL